MKIYWLAIILVSVFFQACNNPDGKNNKENDQNNTAPVKPIKVLSFSKSDVPSSLSYKGKIVDGAKWEDNNGTNYVLITLSGKNIPAKDPNEDGSFYSEINGYCYTGSDNTYKLLWDINESNQGWQESLQFIRNSLEITDINNDGIGESSFFYCKYYDGDVSPMPVKLLMHQGETKYAIRGSLKIEDIDKGQKNFDPAFDSAPSGFKDFASKKWDNTVTRDNIYEKKYFPE